MSLAIDIDLVTEVLLSDGWHKCQPYSEDLPPKRSSFTIDAYEFVEHPRAYATSQPDKHWQESSIFHIPGSPSEMGFRFTDETGVEIFGPLTSIIAVRYRS